MKWNSLVFIAFVYFARANDEAPCTANTDALTESGKNISNICASPRNGIGAHKTFPSRCALATYNCQHKSEPYIYRHDGPCNNNPNDSCKHVCLNSDKIVCGGPISGPGPNITFPNVCELQNYNCDYTDNKYRLVYKGRCEDNSCHKSCSSEDSPICAAPRDGTDDLKTFKNRCHLENYNCDHRSNEYDLINVGACSSSLVSPCQPCSLEFRPVCGKVPGNEVGKTFANQCELDRFNCLHNTNYEYKLDGRCVQSCTSTCLQTYKPACAASLRGDKPPKTFYNRCFLDRHNCEADTSQSDDIFEFLYPGECQIQSSTTSSPNGCRKVCSQTLSPVCTSSSSNPNLRRTFSSKCELENHNCVETRDEYLYIYDGRCENSVWQNETASSCRIQLCSNEIESTICATPRNGIGPHLDFSGNCSLQNYNCLHSYAQYSYYHDGSCTFAPPPTGSLVACKKPCGNVESHVCGISKFFKSTLTFKNMCELDNYNCDHGILGTYEYLHAGKCNSETEPSSPIITEPICRKNCTGVYEPVCASPLWGLGLKRTFHNLCYLDNYNCEHFLLKYEAIHAGECRPDNPSAPIVVGKCLSIHCTQDYVPICGTSRSILSLHKTFSNRCMMDIYNCEHGNDEYNFLHDGVCKSALPPSSSGFACIRDCECTRKPVCAKPRLSRGLRKTFTNICKLDNYNCENYLDPYDVVHEGECGINTHASISTYPTETCIRDCECDYKPVCASPKSRVGPRATFSNRCKLNNHNCESRNDQYQVEHEGECPQFEKIIMQPTNVPNIHIRGSHDCFNECSQEQQPICGKLRDTIGLVELTRTFKNRCEFDNHNCLFKLSKYDYHHNGPCSETRNRYF